MLARFSCLRQAHFFYKIVQSNSVLIYIKVREVSCFFSDNLCTLSPSFFLNSLAGSLFLLIFSPAKKPNLLVSVILGNFVSFVLLFSALLTQE